MTLPDATGHADPDRREALRARLAAELDRHAPYPVARRTLLLLAEAAVEPGPEPLGYRVVDRAGAPRRDPADPARPVTLEGVFTELRARHPALFVARPEPEPEPPPVAAPTEDLKAVTARFVGTQSVLARSLAARSAARGRAAAASLAAGMTGLRTRAEAWRTARATDSRRRIEGAVADFRGQGSRAGDAVRDRLGGLADAAARAADGARAALGPERVPRRRTLLAGFGGLALIALVAVMAGRGDGPASPVSPEPPVNQEEPAEEGAQAAATPPAGDDAASPPPDDAPLRSGPDVRPAPDPETPPAQNAVSGKAEVIDTATLRVGGRLVRLFGVEWVRGGQPEELTRYLAGRPVTCRPVAGSEAFLCAVKGRDLSEVVLFNGGGRASSEATPDLVAAEDRARSERLGVWAR